MKATAFEFLDVEMPGPAAWTRDQVTPRDWVVPFPQAAVAELDGVVESLRARPRPVEDVARGMASPPACLSVMAEVRTRLEHGVGMAVVDRVPVERYRPGENTAIAWLLAEMLGQIVAQKMDGTRLYDVKDSGQALGYGVRRSVTNLAQPFHTDGGWLWMPPAFVGLFCLSSAGEGGLSRLVSLVTVHNEMRRRHPDLLARLYRPFPWDRQAEHPPVEPKVSRHPVFGHDGRTLMVRYYDDYIMNGYTLAGETIDRAGLDALAAARAIVEAPASWIEFRIETGQLQYLDNRRFAHSRTAFRDSPGTLRPRHMLRLWNRDEGSQHIEGRDSA